MTIHTVRNLLIVIFSLALAACSSGPADEAAGEGVFRPGELWPDNNGVHINAHGGGILFHEGVYYWFGQHMVADALALVAQLLEFRQLVDYSGALAYEAVLGLFQGLSELLVGGGQRGVYLEFMTAWFQAYSSPSPIPGTPVMSASTSAAW